MTTRIYRVSPGRWVAVTRHPSGGVVRETYTSGRAALIALDGRNRERVPARTVSLDIAFTAFERFGARLGDIEAALAWPPKHTRRDDWILR